MSGLGSDDDETPFLPAFTSKEILHRFEPEASDPIPLRGSNVLLLLLETDCDAAYLVLAAAPGGEAFPRTVLGIQLSSGDELSDELIASISGVGVIPKPDVAATPTTYLNMDIQVFSGDLLDTVRELGILVYQR